MKMRLGLTTALLIGLAACGRIPGGIDAGKSEAEGSASGWTTLGNRSQPGGPIVPAKSSGAAGWSDYDPPDLYPGKVTQATQFVTMADGTQIAIYVTLPADEAGNAVPGRFPTVLSITGYNNDPATGGAKSYFVRHGYAMVMMDARGTGSSSGVWDAFGAGEQADFAPVIDWITQQAWSDGSIGNFGESYVGITSLLAASKGHPAIKAVFAEIAAADLYRDLAFTGGMISSVFMPGWLGLVTAGSFQYPAKLQDPQYDSLLVQRLIGLPSSFQARLLLGGVTGDPDVVYDGAFSAERSPVEAVDGIRVPTFLTGGLYDIFQRGVPLNYERIKAHAPVKQLIGPWLHTGQGPDLPVDGIPVLDHIALRWFDHYVKGMPVGADTLPNVTQYVAGHGHYVSAPDWPHPQAQAQALYLRGDKSVSQSAPDAGEGSNLTLQQPLNGLCTFNTNQWSAGLAGNLPLPCLENNSWAYPTELVYETAPLAEDLYINGPIEADLWVSTTALDAGLSIRVDDMSGGSGTQISSGLQTVSLRAVDETKSRYLNGLMIQPWHPFTEESAQNVPLAEAVLVAVEIFPTSALIAKGHTLRFSIGASDLMHGIMPLPSLAASAVGVLTVYSDAEHPSRIVLPVVPANQLQ